jgi:alkylation response protein AidB-like acyl-CoA dehydrogenase
MDFDFSPQQVMLRNLAHKFLTEQCPPRHVRQMMDDSLGYGDALWQEMARLGLHGLAIDRAYGGQGLGMVEQALVLEEMGRVAYPGPYFATAILAATALAASADPARMDAHLPAIAAGKTKATLALLEDTLAWGADGVNLAAREEGDGYVLSGVKWLVPFAHAADLLLVAARTAAAADAREGITLFAVEGRPPGLAISPTVGMDRTSRDCTLTFEQVRLPRAAVVGRVGEGWPILQAVLRRAAVASAAEMLGAARKCLDVSVEYARSREQFGQPIGAFQAVKHLCADMLLEVENAHAATYYAAWALDAGAADAALAASVAKAYVSEAARQVCGAAIQVHGGIGFTWEYDLHLYFKRAKHLEALYGSAEEHRELALQAILTPSADRVAASV